MVKKLVIVVLLLVSGTLSVCAQETKEEIQKKQQQLLQEARPEQYPQPDQKRIKKQSLGQLALVQRKINARQELINNINRDLRRSMIIYIKTS